MQRKETQVKSFVILYDHNLWDHAVVGYNDGTFEIIKPEQLNNPQWLAANLDETIHVRSTNVKPPVVGMTAYEPNGLARAPKPALKKIKAFHVNNANYDITFLADYLSEDRTWFVVADSLYIQPI
jgi:hypothetical protein